LQIFGPFDGNLDNTTLRSGPVGSGVKEKSKGKPAKAAASGGMTMTLDGTLELYVESGRLVLLELGGSMSLTTRKENKETISSGSGTVSFRVAYSDF